LELNGSVSSNTSVLEEEQSQKLLEIIDIVGEKSSQESIHNNNDTNSSSGRSFLRRSRQSFVFNEGKLKELQTPISKSKSFIFQFKDKQEDLKEPPKQQQPPKKQQQQQQQHYKSTKNFQTTKKSSASSFYKPNLFGSSQKIQRKSFAKPKQNTAFDHGSIKYKHITPTKQ